MDKNGFTLIELIITIALLGFVGIVISTNILKVIERQKQSEEEQAIELMNEAGCTYSIISSTCEAGCSVDGEILINEGLIDEEINGINVDEYKVVIYFNNGEKICEAVEK